MSVQLSKIKLSDGPGVIDAVGEGVGVAVFVGVGVIVGVSVGVGELVGVGVIVGVSVAVAVAVDVAVGVGVAVGPASAWQAVALKSKQSNNTRRSGIVKSHLFYENGL